jgi:serine/threonine-protein kinase
MAAPAAVDSSPGPQAPKPAAAPGTLRLAVSPWAEVALEGRSLGNTPIRPMSLPPGTYVVRLSHPDFHPLQRKVTIRPGEVTRLEVDLAQDAFPRTP